jgi:hypothetical protein
MRTVQIEQKPCILDGFFKVEEMRNFFRPVRIHGVLPSCDQEKEERLADQVSHRLVSHHYQGIGDCNTWRNPFTVLL